MDGDLQPRKQKMEVLRVEDELGIGSRSKSPCMTGFEDNSADAKEKEKPLKVLRRGCWEKINFRKALAQLNIGNESRLFSNPWIKHFMHTSNDQELPDVQLSSSQGGSVLPSEAMHTQRRKCRTTNCGPAMSSDHPLSHHSDKHDQDFDDSNAEFSDQNFVDEDGLKGEQLINSCIEKMVNITGVDVSIKD